MPHHQEARFRDRPDLLDNHIKDKLEGPIKYYKNDDYLLLASWLTERIEIPVLQLRKEQLAWSSIVASWTGVHDRDAKLLQMVSNH
jgi:hypothetical protein